MGIDKNFVVKHGLEVNTDLILANAVTGQVGIATTVTKYTLHVNGGIGATNLSVTGVATFPQLVLSGTVSAASSTGVSGQYLKSTGSGVVWEDFPVGRTSTTFAAAAGQDTFSFAYAVGLLDVFVNGIKLTPSEFTASDGVSIVLTTPCFGGETVDVYAYSVSGIGVGGTGITGLTVQDEGSVIGTPQGVTSINFIGAGLTASASGAGLTVSLQDAWTPSDVGISTLSNVGVGTTNPRFSLEVGPVGYADTALWVNGNARITGILTVGTSSIVLDGSTDTLTVPNLVVTNTTTGVTASGVGITVRDGGGDLGSAEIIDFGDNLSVSFSSGVATIDATGGGGESYWSQTDVGIHTLSNVGIGTTNPTSALTVKGNTSLETLNVSGISTFNNTVNFGSSGSISTSGNNLLINANTDIVLSGYQGGTKITSQPGANLIFADAVGGDVSLYFQTGPGALGSEKRLQTLGTGVTVTGTTFTNQLSVSGVVTATSFSGSNTLKERTTVIGLTTSIANSGIGNTNIIGYKSYALMKVGLSTAGWLRLYTDSTSRDNDVSRSIGEDPQPGSGVIAEVVTTGVSTSQIISPFVMGGNLNDPADTTIYAAITNLSGISTSISVNLTLLQLEA